MIRPRPRLTLWYALVVLPFGVAIALAPQWSIVSVAVLLVFCLTVAVDAYLAGRGIRSLVAHVDDTTRLTRNRAGSVAVTLTRAAGKKDQIVRLGLALPATVECPPDGILTRIPAGLTTCSIGMPCTPHCRGNVSLSTVFAEGVSPLGLWAARRALPVVGQLRCYPNLLPERRHLAALFLNREGLGIHSRRQIGQGRDFEKLREYLPGDSFEDIHWRATAKRRRPITKQYQIERTQEVYVLIDAGRLSLRQTPATELGTAPTNGDLSILETTIRAALVLGLVAERQGDLFGVVSFSDRVHSFVRARNGQAHFSACRDALYALEGKSVSPDFAELGAFLRTRLRRRALLVFLTSLDDPQLAESFEHAMALLGRQHVIITAMFKPSGAEPLFSRPVRDTDGIYNALSGHLTWESLSQLRVALHRRGVIFRLLESETLCPDLVTQYITVKQRQVL